MTTVDFVYLFNQMEWLGNQTYETLRLDIFAEYLEDIEYFSWLLWLLTPIIMAFLLPGVLVFLLYLSAVITHIYRHRYDIKESCTRGDIWDGARHIIAVLWEAHGWFWFGYEVVGMENIPSQGPALLVYYHGALPVDYYYLASKVFITKHRLMRTVGDRFLFKVPGWKLLLEVALVTAGTVQTCSQILKEGNLLSIAPGGVLEAQFGDETYQLLWGQRRGFAKVALEAKVPIIPMFTQNVREAFRSLSLFRSPLLYIYSKYKLPLVPVYGGFPVKLRTFVGEPIPYDPSLSVEQLAEKTADAVRDLIKQHQRLPGNIFCALLDRFRKCPKLQKLA